MASVRDVSGRSVDEGTHGPKKRSEERQAGSNAELRTEVDGGHEDAGNAEEESEADVEPANRRREVPALLERQLICLTSSELVARRQPRRAHGDAV